MKDLGKHYITSELSAFGPRIKTSKRHFWNSIAADNRSAHAQTWDGGRKTCIPDTACAYRPNLQSTDIEPSGFTTMQTAQAEGAESDPTGATIEPFREESFIVVKPDA